MRKLSNFLADILEVSDNEEITEIVITSKISDYGSPDPRDLPIIPFIDKVVPFKQLSLLLNYEYDDDYGGQDCHNFYAWTRTKILSIHEYDGSTRVISVPRNPNNYRD